jgi:hypothetical protein
MTDRQTIADTFDRLEAEAGGITAPGADARIIAERVAAELRIPVDDVIAVILDMTTPWGAG